MSVKVKRQPAPVGDRPGVGSQLNYMVECARCRHRHYEKDRVKGKTDKQGLTTLICPKCNATAFYLTKAGSRLPYGGNPQRISTYIVAGDSQ